MPESNETQEDAVAEAAPKRGPGRPRLPDGAFKTTMVLTIPIREQLRREEAASGMRLSKLVRLKLGVPLDQILAALNQEPQG